jgi:urease accessory protein
MDALLLALLDSRAPTGAHSHSAGMEAAIMTGAVRDLGDVERHCRLRLRTSGRVNAEFAAAACAVSGSTLGGRPEQWAELDIEFDARTPSAAARAASRQLGGGLRRLVRAMLPAVDFGPAWAQCGRPAPHQPLVLGAAVALAGGGPQLAGVAAALGTAATAASAAVRLLGLDPYAVQGVLAGLAAEINATGAARAGGNLGDFAGLPALGAPALDLLADVHARSEVRLFAS